MITANTSVYPPKISECVSNVSVMSLHSPECYRVRSVCFLHLSLNLDFWDKTLIIYLQSQYILKLP